MIKKLVTGKELKKMADNNGENKDLISKATSTLKSSVGIKMIIIFFLLMVLLIPLGMVENLINERQYRKNGVINEISSKWGNSQTVKGPFLTIPYKSYYKTDKGVLKYSTEYLHVLPESLNVDGDLGAETRYRGIYEAILYNSKMNLKGEFKYPDFSKLGINAENVKWNGIYISIGITDMRGITEEVKGTFGDVSFSMDPGVDVDHVVSTGMSSRVALNSKKETYPFQISINVNGSQYLYFTPVGKVTEVTLKSPWANPSFDGSYLPVEREVTEEGFTAKWKVLHLNRSFPQQWIDRKYNVDNGPFFGVKFLNPVDVYRKSTRMSKYGLLFMVFTFAAFFFSEISRHVRVHPVQYMMVGFAIVLFYSLLLSISEHLNFDIAYIASAVAVVTLISVYAKGVFNNTALGLSIGGILTLLYGYLYMLLQMQDYALLLGSIGLFAVLAYIMYKTRQIDWYSLKLEE